MVNFLSFAQFFSSWYAIVVYLIVLLALIGLLIAFLMVGESKAPKIVQADGELPQQTKTEPPKTLRLKL